MGRYHCDKVSEQLQQIEGVRVVNITDSSWSFVQNDARVNLRVLPGCCGILLAYNLSGSAKALARLLKYVTRAAGKTNFGIVLLSLREDSAINKLLLAPDWIRTPFTNPRTGNNVEVLMHKIPKPVKVKKPAPRPEDD